MDRLGGWLLAGAADLLWIMLRPISRLSADETGEALVRSWTLADADSKP